MAVQATPGSPQPPPALQDEMLISTDAAAILIGMSASWLTKSRMAGDGPRYLKIGKRVLYRPSDLWTWVEAHQRRSTSDAA